VTDYIKYYAHVTRVKIEKINNLFQVDINRRGQGCAAHYEQYCQHIQGRTFQKFLGGGVPNVLGPTFMAQYPNNNNNNKIFICIIVSADMIALIAGFINTSSEILFSSYPPAPSHSQKTASLLFKYYNLKIINKRIGAKLLQFVHAIVTKVYI
jgi:hypothetical protein